MLQFKTSAADMEQYTQAQAERRKVADKTIRLVHAPCKATRCATFDIDPDEFLNAAIAPICWDCRFVTQKIRL